MLCRMTRRVPCGCDLHLHLQHDLVWVDVRGALTLLPWGAAAALETILEVPATTSS
jgi:hypothetical protein